MFYSHFHYSIYDVMYIIMYNEIILACPRLISSCWPIAGLILLSLQNHPRPTGGRLYELGLAD